MQKTIIITLLNLLFFITVIFGQNETGREMADRETIKRAIMDYYHEGHVKSDSKYYEEILHDDWKIFYLNEK